MRDLLSTQIGILPEKPRHVPSANWEAIVAEHKRLVQADSKDDLSGVVGQCKSLVESVSRVVLEINGRPAQSNTPYQELVQEAHDLLKDPSTEGNTVQSAGRIASTQISKIVKGLGEYRNSCGTGHGRAFVPEIREDTIFLFASTALLWTHWAIPRLSTLSSGRPESLITDLIIDNQTFRRGSVIERLRRANLPTMQPHHQREVGVAVARRAMQGTFVVAEDGVESCSNSNSLDFWTEEYRFGVVTGLFTDKNGDLTITRWAVEQSLVILTPIKQIAEEIEKLDRLLKSFGIKAELALSEEEKYQLANPFNSMEKTRANGDRISIQNLRSTLQIPAF